MICSLNHLPYVPRWQSLFYWNPVYFYDSGYYQRKTFSYHLHLPHRPSALLATGGETEERLCKRCTRLRRPRIAAAIPARHGTARREPRGGSLGSAAGRWSTRPELGRGTAVFWFIKCINPPGWVTTEKRSDCALPPRWKFSASQRSSGCAVGVYGLPGFGWEEEICAPSACFCLGFTQLRAPTSALPSPSCTWAVCKGCCLALSGLECIVWRADCKAWEAE